MPPRSTLWQMLCYLLMVVTTVDWSGLLIVLAAFYLLANDRVCAHACVVVDVCMHPCCARCTCAGVRDGTGRDGT